MLCVLPEATEVFPTGGADLNGDGVLDTKDNFPARYPIWFRIRRTGTPLRRLDQSRRYGLARGTGVFQVISAADTQDVGVFVSAYSAKGEPGRAVFSRFEVEGARRASPKAGMGQ